MTTQLLPVRLPTPLAGILLLVCFLLNASTAVVAELMFVEGTFPVDGECVPLRVLTEREIKTHVGEVCATFRDKDQQDYLQVTYNTTTSGYVMDTIQLFYGHDPALVPSDPVSGKPDPLQFEFQQQLVEQQEVSMNVPLDPRGFMTCPSETNWVKYFVAHATVHLPEDNSTLVDVFGHEGILYNYNDVDQGTTEYYSYFKMDLACKPEVEKDEADESLTAGPTQDDSDAPSDVPSNVPSWMPSDAPSTVPSWAPTGPVRSFGFNSALIQPASSAPSDTLAPSMLAGEDMVVGLSFTVLTQTSKAVHDLPHDMVQASFEGFARDILHEMHVAPLPAARRKLWVKYHNDSFTVYDFTVNTDCINNDPVAQAITKTSSLRPPPERSQCHRAYARFTVRLVDEDPTTVCETLRNGTLAGFFQGRLQDIHEQQYPNSPVRLQPGNFEYCVPVKDFVVPDHELDHWMESNPLANLTILPPSIQSEKETPWWILILVACLLAALALATALCVVCKNRKHDKKEAKPTPPQEEASLMS